MECVKKVQEDVRQAAERRSSLKPEVILVLILLGVTAAITAGLIAIALGEVAAAAAIALGPRLAHVAATAALTTAASAPAYSGSGPSPKVSDVSNTNAGRLKKLLEALDRMEALKLPFDAQGYQPPDSGDGLSGGVPATDYEESILRVIDTRPSRKPHSSIRFILVKETICLANLMWKYT